MTRFRARFTIRTLAIFVTLVCAYFGAWEVTKRNARTRANATIYGENDEPLVVSTATIPLPFVVVRNAVQYRNAATARQVREHRRSYYIWLFGPRFRVHYREGNFLPMGRDPARG